MKKVNHIIYICLALILTMGCQEDDSSFGSVVAPTNLQLDYTIINADEENEFGDGSGEVQFTATADNALNFKYVFGDNQQNISSDGSVLHTFSTTGTNTYTVTVIASGTGGAQTSTSVDVTVLSLFEDEETKALLTGNDSKTWYVASQEPGHLGVGPLDSPTPDFFSASPNERVDEGCFYNDEITISLADNGIAFDYENQGASFANAAFTPSGEDQCIDIDVSGTKSLNLSGATSGLPEDVTTGTQFSITDDGFMSYFINTSTYEVLEITEDYLYVRGLSGVASPLAWYVKFTTNPDGTVGGSADEPNMLETEYEELVFEDDFNEDGAPDSNVWNFETGNGEDGWGNQELQYYTEDNAVVEDGILKITAKREDTNGFEYSSSRLNTMDNFSFEYGRVEVRAKLPEGGGTWPAIWMLGDNFTEVGWPETGEIDIMEHVGNDQDVIHGSLHLPGNFAGNAITQSTTVAGVSQEFKNYTVEWSPERILFAVNNEVYHEYTNTSDTPFNAAFFLILNVAMGGTFGGDVDANFTESSTMEIDYVRVYQ